jgi:hypothetical protein
VPGSLVGAERQALFFRWVLIFHKPSRSAASQTQAGRDLRESHLAVFSTALPCRTA